MIEKFLPIFFITTGVLFFLAMGYWFFYNLSREKRIKEKEEKLLKLYLCFEEVAEEFGSELTKKKEVIEEKLSVIEKRLEGGLQKTAGITETKQTPETAEAPIPEPPPAKQEPSPPQDAGETPKNKKALIRALARTGLTPIQIAQELGIARTEVELFLGFSGKQ